MRRILLALVMAACGTTEDPVPTYGEGLGTAENPVPQDGVPYSVHTQTSAPSTATQAEVTRITGSLRQFSQSPGKTMLALAKQASPEQLASLDAMSTTLRSRLEAWIDTEIDKVVVDGMRSRAVAAELADFADAALAHYSLESTLSFSPTKTTHTLAAVSFRLAGLDVVVPVGGLAGDETVQRVPLTVGESGSLSFGDQTFGIDFGPHAWHGINLALTSQLGVGVDSALSSAVNCRALAQAVSLKCYSGSCVGHASEITSLCENSVAWMMDAFQDDIAGSSITSIRFTSGTARLVDENGDGLANRIDAGSWTPDPGVGVGSAMFTAITAGR
jgi:hypothetical protein